MSCAKKKSAKHRGRALDQRRPYVVGGLRNVAEGRRRRLEDDRALDLAVDRTLELDVFGVHDEERVR
jgi:hypothetical protein